MPVVVRRCEGSSIEDIGDVIELRTLSRLPSGFFISSLGLGRAHCDRAIVLDLVGRSEDVITASITITVVMVVAAISPQQAGRQPILRVIDTIVGIAVGIGGAWIGLKWLPAFPIRRRRASDKSMRRTSAGEMDNLLILYE